MFVPPNPESGGHNPFEEFCALAVIGELSAEELGELQRHLAECPKCRELYADFSRLGSDDIARVLLAQRSDAGLEEAAGRLDEQALFSRLFARAQGERPGGGIPAPCEPVETCVLRTDAGRSRGLGARGRRTLAYAALACSLCAVAGVGGYLLRGPELARRSSELKAWKGQAETAAANVRAMSESLDQSQAKQRSLEKSVRQEQVRAAELKAQQPAFEAHRKALEAGLSARQIQLNQLGQELNAARAEIQEKDSFLTQLDGRLQDALGRAADQERIAEDLRTRLRPTDAAAAAPPGREVGDAEAKELLGARDLQIVDVYDVDSNGRTQRTYGRVYYVEKKLLVFYAFDLQDKPHMRAAVGFQAWGYREASQSRPESLGLFHLDDAVLKRWVLNVRNPRVLQHIDAVFVSLEPPGGSRVPHGRRVLYAYLAGTPNHP